MFKKKKMKEIQSLEKTIALCQEYTQLWSAFFNFFADGFESRKITPEMEAKFFEIMTVLARKQYRLRYFLKDSCPSDEKILGILSNAVSLASLHEESEADFSKLQHGWHVIFIALNKSLGRLIQRHTLLTSDGKDNGDKKKKNGKNQPPSPAKKTAPPQAAKSSAPPVGG